MDSISLVKTRIDDGRRLLDLLAEANIKVAVAGWVRTSEESWWFLYIATELVDREGLVAAYTEVYKVLRKIEGTRVGTSDIKLVGLSHPITRDLLQIRNGNEPDMPSISHGPLLGNIGVDEIYVYSQEQPLRQAARVTYSRTNTDSNQWTAFASLDEIYRDLDFKGVVSYSTVRWEGEQVGHEALAAVSLLMDMSPRLGVGAISQEHSLKSFLKRQAIEMADEAFKMRYPGAEILHIDQG